MKLQPLGNRVVLSKIKDEEKSSSGIIIPDTADEKKSQQGVVVATGSGKKVKKLGLRKGDKVLFKEYGPSEVEIDEEEYLIAEEDDILAVVK